MKKALKRALSIVTVSALLVSLVACGSPAASAPAAPSASTASDATAELPKAITFMTSQAKFFKAYQDVADAIKADTGIDVQFQVVPDNDFTAMLKVKLSTSEVPDVFQYNFPTSNRDIGASEFCSDLGDQPWVKRLVNPDLLKDPVDGKLYALPANSSSTYLAVYYNKKVMADIGITDPNPETYQEFLDILQTVKEKGNGVIPFYQTNKDTWTTQIFMTSGFSVMLDDRAAEVESKLLSNKLKWNEVPEFNKVLNQYLDLIKNGYVNKDNLSATYDMAPEAIGTGKAAMYLSVEQFVGIVNTQYPDTEMGSFIIPWGDVNKMATGAYVQGIFVPKAGKQAEKAKAFLDLWSQPKYQKVFFASQPGAPAYNDVDGGVVPDCVKSVVEKYINSGNYVYQLNDPMGIAATTFGDLWNFYIETITGTKTVDQAFVAYQKIYEDYMKQQQYPGF